MFENYTIGVKNTTPKHTYGVWECALAEGIFRFMEIPALLQQLIDGGLTQADLAKRLSTTQQSISRWLNGEREPSGPAKKLIRELAAERGMVDEEKERRQVEILGKIGGGVEIEPEYEQTGNEFYQLPFPIADGLVGFRIDGDSMMPVYEEDALIIVEREQPYATDRMIGLCAAVWAEAAGGKQRRYIKRIQQGSRRGRFNLESINDRSPLIRDVRILWASPVLMIIPNIGLKNLGRLSRRAGAAGPAKKG